MQRNRPVNVAKSAILFDQIVKFAKIRNGAALRNLAASRVSFKIRKGIDTPLSLLASEGDVDAVNLLMQYLLPADLEEARPDVVEGYARGGFRNSVNNNLVVALDEGVETAVFAVRARAFVGYAGRGAVDFTYPPIPLDDGSAMPRDEYYQYVIEGYAKGGHHALVEEEILRVERDFAALFDVVHAAIKGYALKGDAIAVDAILQRAQQVSDFEPEFHALHIERAAYYYCVGGWVGHVNAMLAKYSDMTWVDLRNGYAYGGHLGDRESLLHLLSSTEDQVFRGVIASKAHELNPALHAFNLLRNASYIRDVMKTYALDYDETRRFLAQGARAMTWLLQGPQLVRDNKLSAEIFLHISTYVLGLSRSSSEKVHAALNQRLLAESCDAVTRGFRSRFFSSYFDRQKKGKLAELEGHYEERNSYYLSIS